MPTKRHEPLLEERVIYWFVHPSTRPPTPLGFLRDDWGRAFIIGGLTGSHYGGHADSWWDQFGLVVAKGYIPVELAVKIKIVPPDWSPPALNESDSHTVRIIHQNGHF